MRKDSPYYEQSIKILQSTFLFNGVREDTLEEILGYVIPITLPKRSTIDYSVTKESIFIILKGRAKLSKINPQNGREYIISLLSEGDIFDIISFLDKKEHEINIESVDKIQLLKAPMDVAHSWLNKNPQFNKNFLPYIGKRMQSLEDAGADLALYDTITRLAKLILNNIDYNHTAKEDEQFSLKLINDLSHEAIAQMIGSVRKVVNLHIQELKKEDIITSIRGNLSVKNLQKLIEKYGDI